MRRIDDDIITARAPFPKIEAVEALDGFQVRARWADGRRVVADLAPTVLAFKVYAPLREDRALFESVHIVNPSVIAWGEDDAIDMHVSEIERLAGELMDDALFKDFLKDMQLTYDGAAALLGLSRRTVAYYAAGAVIPRYIALACKYLREERKVGAKRLLPKTA